MAPEQPQSAPYRRFGECRVSECDKWNAGDQGTDA